MSSLMLLVDDDEAVHLAVRQVAIEIGLELVGVTTGEAGIREAAGRTLALAIIDLTLPDIGGLEVCREIRRTQPDLPIIILTSRDDEANVVLGLEIGADEYLIKPFRFAEFSARLRALLRRAGRSSYAAPAHPADSPLRVGELVIDLVRRTVMKNDSPLNLRRLEFDLLAYLALHVNIPVSREELIENVWGYQSGDFRSTVTAHIRRLRMQIERNPPHPEYLLTRHSIGYMLIDPQKAGAVQNEPDEDEE